MDIDNITDKELIKRLLKGIANGPQGRQARWSHVGFVLSTGSTSATNICKKYDINPHEEIGHDKCIDCELID